MQLTDSGGDLRRVGQAARDRGLGDVLERARVQELRGWSVEAAEAYELQSTPLGRKVTKEEVASVIAHVMFGPKAQTGEIIAVNGGR